jgi:hypothetical protein
MEAIMRRNREGYLVNETHRECTGCGVIFEKTSKMTLCASCNSTRVKSMTPAWRMHQRAKIRAKESGLEFTIDVSDVQIPEICPVLGIYMNMNSGRSGAFKNSPSLDRIDNNKGYIKGNVQVISQLANAMKGAASKDELIKFAEWVFRTYKDNA